MVSKSGRFPDCLRSFWVLALVAVPIPISSRIFRWCHDPLFLRRPFANCLASLFLLFGVFSRHFYCSFWSLLFGALVRLRVSLQAQHLFMSHRFFLLFCKRKKPCTTPCTSTAAKTLKSTFKFTATYCSIFLIPFLFMPGDCFATNSKQARTATLEIMIP